MPSALFNSRRNASSVPTARTASAQESLGGIDAYVTELKEAMGSLDGEILQTVREQTGAGSSARRDLESGKAAMLELFGKVREIRFHG